MKAKDSLPRRVTLSEWQSLLLPGERLGPADRRLVNDLQIRDGGRLIVEELLAGVRVEARSWVGVVRFEQFEICVEPKLAGNNLGLVEMLEFAAGLDALRRTSFPRARTLRAEDFALFDLIALLLAEACEYLMRGGLLADYVTQEEDLPVIRGRFLAAQQLLRPFRRLDRLACRFDEHEQDILENRLLGAALGAAAQRIHHEELRRRLRALRALFEEVCRPEQLDLAAAPHELVYHRMNEHYRDAHTLAWLILDGLGTKDLLAADTITCFSFLLDMNALFEQFVYRLIDRLCIPAGLRVHYQLRDSSIVINMATHRPYARIVPDILVEDRTGGVTARVAVEAKYKLYDDRKLAPADVYQSFLYAYAYGPTSFSGPPAAILLYPATRDAARSTYLRVRNAQGRAGADLFALGLSIPAALAEIKDGYRGPATDCLREAIRCALTDRYRRAATG